jgi:hypothetical protein
MQPLISRRALMLSLVGGCVAGCAGAAGGNVFYGTGGFTCAAGLPRTTRVYPEKLDDFEDLDLEEQRDPEHCWAAAIQAIFAFHGMSVSQEDIVARVKGAGGKGAGKVREIIRGLSGRSTTWYLNNGDGRTLIADLKAGNPVLVGIRRQGYDIGHVIVVYGATYTMNQMTGQVFIDQVDIWDPEVGAGLDTISACDLEDELAFALHAWRPR